MAASASGFGSRLCVKNLPRHATEARIKEVFSSKGEVTDVKVLRTKDGRSRQICFVGFRSPDEAENALKYFDKAFMDTSRLMVEPARKVTGATTERPWSKYSKGSSAHERMASAVSSSEADKGDADAKKSSSKKGKASKGDEAELDPKLAEFLQVMQPRSKSRMWANDDLLPDGSDKSARNKPWEGAGANISKEEQAQKAANRKAVKEALQFDDDDDDDDDDDIDAVEDDNGDNDSDDGDGSSDSGNEVDDDDEVKEEAKVSDLDFLRNKTVKGNFDDDDNEDEDDDDDSEDGDEEDDDEQQGVNDDEEDEEDGSDDEEMEEAEANKEGPSTVTDKPVDEADISETGRLFLRNLPYSATEEDIRELFEPFGELTDCHLVLDRERRTSKGMAFVTYLMPEDAVRAASELDANDFQGRLLHIIPARLPPHSKTAAAPTEDSTNFKAKKEADLKSQAGNRSAWNSLFMRQDTVAEAIAAHFGVTKRDLLNRDTADLPVRMALGETHVIAATKKGLGDRGVRVEVIEAAAVSRTGASVQRSSCCLLVKNLPFSVTSEELQAMFESIGPLSRLVLPETRTLALVEYLEAQDARRAFKALAYKRCHHVPLYLEWAPEGIFSEGAPLLADGPGAEAGGGPEEEEAAVTDSLVVAGLVDAENDNEAEGSREIYVKNLNFETRDKALRGHFAAAAKAAGGKLLSAQVPLKDGKNGKKLSLGYGFVELDSEASARGVIKALQGSMLDGHKLVVQLSTAKQGSAANKPGGDKKRGKAQDDESKTKLVIRNVAFEATRKDLASLFGAVGQLKSLRLPKKFDGGHRGFAFAEYVTQQEAQSAIDTVAGTHLYGRRLVVERAKEGEGLDELRDKTAAKFHADEQPKSKRQKKGAGDSFEDLA